MAETSVKGRVYAAADQISAERTPTVSTVRDLAGVSNADATRYLKEWKEERLAAASKIAAAPQSVTELAARMAGMVWSEAAGAADARHAEVEKAWRDERDHKDRELRELAGELDKLTVTMAEEKASAQRRINELLAEAERQGTKTGAMKAELSAATSAAANLSTELAKAQATIETLQDTQRAIIARLNPAPDSDLPAPDAPGKD